MKIQSTDKVTVILVFCVLAACSPVMEVPTSLPIATTVVPSATSTLTETSTVTKLPTVTLTATPVPTRTSTPAPIIINPSMVINEDTVKDLMLLGTINLESSFIHSVAFSQDGNLLAAAPWEGQIKLWDVSTLEEMETLVTVDSSAQLFSRSANQILAAKGFNDDLTIWDLTTGELVYSFLGPLFFEDPAVSSDGSLMAVSSTGWPSTENIIIWDLKNQKEVQTLYGDWTTDNARGYPTVYTVYFSPDASLLAAFITDGRSIVWDVDSGERVKEFNNTWVFAFSHDGSILATSVNNYLIGVYDTTTWKLENASIYNSTLVRSIKFSLDDELLIVVTWDGNITFWNWKTGERIRTISPSSPHAPLLSRQQIALSPDGTLLVYCYNQKVENGMQGTTIDIWGVP